MPQSKWTHWKCQVTFSSLNEIVNPYLQHPFINIWHSFFHSTVHSSLCSALKIRIIRRYSVQSNKKLHKIKDAPLQGLRAFSYQLHQWSGLNTEGRSSSKHILIFLILIFGCFTVNIPQRRTSWNKTSPEWLLQCLLNSTYFLTLVSEFVAMIIFPSWLASDADTLQLAKKGFLVFNAPQSQPIPLGCRNRNLNLLLIVAAQRPEHATGRESVELSKALTKLAD